MMCKYRAACGLAATLLCAACAQFSGEPEVSAVSGANTDSTRTLEVTGQGAGDEYALEQITWGERGDHPCYLKAHFRTIEDREGVTTKQLVVCDGSVGQERTVMLPAFIDELYVNEIVTCDSKDNGNRRIKGIQIWGSHVGGARAVDASEVTCTSSSGNATIRGPCRESEVYSAAVDLANCGDRNRRVACPSGMIANGVVAHLADDEPRDIVGLALKCRQAILELDG